MDDKRITQYLLGKFESLNSQEQTALQVLALGGLWTSRSQLQKCLQACLNNSVDYRGAGELFFSLVEKGFAVEESKLYCHVLLERAMNERALANDDFSFWLKEVERALPTGFNWGVDVKQQIARGYRYAAFKAASGDWDGFVATSRRMISDYRAAFKAADFIEKEVVSRYEYTPFEVSQSLLDLVMEQGPDITAFNRKLPLGFYRYSLLNLSESKHFERLVAFLFSSGDSETLYQAAASNPLIQAVVLFLQGDSRSALRSFDSLLSQTKISPFFLLFYGAVIIDLELTDRFSSVATMLEKAPVSPFKRAALTIASYLSLRSGKRKLWQKELESLDRSAPDTIWHKLFTGLVLNWYDRDVWKRYFRSDDFSGRYLKALGYDWLAFQFDAVAGKPSAGNYRALIKLVPEVPEWQRKLNDLMSIGGVTSSTSAERLVWMVSCRGRRSVEPRIQKKGSNGWTKGRAVALSKLVNGEVACMSRHDYKVAELVQLSCAGGYGTENSRYTLNFELAVEALSGHPLVFSSVDVKSLNIVKVEPVLYVSSVGNGCNVRLNPYRRQSGVEVLYDGDSVLEVIRFSSEHAEIADFTGMEGVTVPKDQLPQIQRLIETLSPMVQVHTDIETEDEEELVYDGDASPVLRLYMNHGTLKVEVVTIPYAESATAFLPSSGSPVFYEHSSGLMVKVVRNFAAEKEELKRLLEACPRLGDAYDGSGVWLFDNPEVAMEVVDEIYQVRDLFRVEWPTGKKLEPKGESGLESLQLRIKHDRGWFDVKGSLKIDKHTMVELSKLLEKITDRKSPYVRLTENTFIKLTDHLQSVLDEFNTVLEARDDGFAFGGFKLPLIAQTLQKHDLEISGDKAWREQLASCLKAFDLQPEVPSTFAAELRDYQFDGFQWLVRMSEAGCGACLADDMGLGKTVQTLALLVQRVTTGPALVIAPASVCHNWMEESRRFAPTLKPLLLAETEDRAEALKKAGKFDLIICSYSMLNIEEENLQAVKWGTVVLDEAQMIKNHSTARYKSAVKLDAGFRMIATGTPVENSLTELWNLFNFINPGLLGRRREFFDKYVQGIERHNDTRLQMQLRHLIKPFVLRRMKCDVLDELPEKTEITIKVDLSEREKTFYQLLRQNVVKSLENYAHGAKGMHVLSGIMKLRRAACSPSLLAEDQTVGSSKIAEMVQLVKELVGNGHKALIFSQFTDYLKIASETVAQQGITSFYLDGSTSQPKRKILIDSFQNGEADLFFISLKAGGTGLNLTAADYVIHLDPWWNPAVEDQASDRVHRIGQERPVTVYRLIAAGTIEEKITALHAQKRELAESMLDMSASSLTIDQMMELIGR